VGLWFGGNICKMMVGNILIFGFLIFFYLTLTKSLSDHLQVGWQGIIVTTMFLLLLIFPELKKVNIGGTGFELNGAELISQSPCQLS